MWPRKYGWLNFAILECSLNVWIVNKIVFAAPELFESALPNPKFLLHCRKWRNINLSWRKFQTSISSTLRIFFSKNLQTWSVEPIEHFGIYFGYIRRLFQSWVSPFNHVYRIATFDVLFNMLYALTCAQTCISLMRMFMLDVGCAPSNRYVQSINSVFSLTLNSDIRALAIRSRWFYLFFFFIRW